MNSKIHVLDSETIDKIAAGEVVERPASVVKELVENAIDAKADAITVEVKDGGIAMIRVTDNGLGMEADEVSTAFLRHATSKIQNANDLYHIESLGFRGEALSSIAAVSMVEIITKTKDALTGTRMLLEGGIEKEVQEVGAPSGTTFIMRNLFFNTPVRRNFLKQAATEGGYITDLMEHLALSHPDISFQFILGNQVKFHTSGNGDLREVIYRVYGREIANALIPIQIQKQGIRLEGYLGKPVLVRSNRNYEVFYVNGRFIKSNVIARAVEEGYKEYLMQHKFPFCVMHITIDSLYIDVNVHPTKMEVRFSDSMAVGELIKECIEEALQAKEMIPEASLEDEKKTYTDTVKPQKVPEPFEQNRVKEYKVMEEAVYQTSPSETKGFSDIGNVQQMNLFEERILTAEKKQEYRMIGQVFDTYWMIQWEDKLLLIDQHAAHEKVKYERFMKLFRERRLVTQTLFPPIIVTLNGQEEAVLKTYKDEFERLGFEMEEFGGNEYTLRAVPADLYGCSEKELFLSVLDELSEGKFKREPGVIEEKIASMACKAAVKGNQLLSIAEANKLIEELLTLDNPYHCPHGRPTIITISKYEMEKKFKRIV